MAISANIKRRRHVKRILLERNGYQFGQPNCSLVTRIVPGDVACADTCIQMVARICRGLNLSLNFIRGISNAPQDVPLPVEASERTLRRLRLPYEIRTGLNAKELMLIARNRGPVLIAEDYWAHPQWKDYNYGGIRQDGKARNASGRDVWVGFAKPLEKAGNNQPTFSGGHMVLLATSRRVKGGNIGYIRDPNHNSNARPERPAWDVVNTRQLNRMLRSFNKGRGVVAIVPTEVVVKP